MNPNGSSPVNIPPDIEWDEDNPPTIFTCSQHTEHQPGCDGSCEANINPTKLEIELLNEARAWARAGMNFHGVPRAYDGVIRVPGINVELFDLECKMQVFRQALIDIVGIDEQDLEERFREYKLSIMRHIREMNEAAVRRSRMEASLAIPKKPLFGPDGRPLQ